MSNFEMSQAANTDRELWREREGDYYADRIFVTEGGGIGMEVGGSAVVMPIRQWAKLAGALPTKAIPSMVKPTNVQGPTNVCKGSPDGPSKGPAAANPQRVYPFNEYERRALDRVVSILTQWRAADHEDSIMLTRHEVIMLLEGLRRAHIPVTAVDEVKP